jgi:hypothetical protein
MPTIPSGEAREAQEARIRGEIARALRLYHEPGAVYELRALDAHEHQRDRWRFTLTGYYDDAELAAGAIVRAMRTYHAAGWYVTLNPCIPALLSRSARRIGRARQGDATKDHEIARRRWLPIDIDPVRPRGVSSSEVEHTAALDLARYIRGTLASEGWPTPILTDSGNGAHLLYRIDLENDADASAYVRRAIEGLAGRFDTEEVTIDRTVHNAARIMRIPGTLTRKGDSTSDRPHRWARLLDVPGGVE